MIYSVRKDSQDAMEDINQVDLQKRDCIGMYKQSKYNL